MKKVLVLGGGGFIGGHLAKKLKNEGCWVRICDVKKHEYFEEKDILLDPYLLGVYTPSSGSLRFPPRPAMYCLC